MEYRTPRGVFSFERLVAAYPSATDDERGVLAAQILGQNLGEESARMAIVNGERRDAFAWTRDQIRPKIYFWDENPPSANRKAFMSDAYGTPARNAVYVANFIDGFRERWHKWKQLRTLVGHDRSVGYARSGEEIGAPENVFDIL